MKYVWIALVLVLPSFGAEDNAPRVVGRVPPKAPLGSVVTAPGRFIPITPPAAVPSFLADSEAYRIYRVPAGTVFVGIQYDAAPNAEPEAYKWTEKMVYVLLARNLPGTYQLQFLKNGPEDIGPVVNGNPLTISITGPRPPPGPTPPTPPTPPQPPEPTPGPLRVLFVYDPQTFLSPQQEPIKRAQVIRDYLIAKCGKGPDGNPEARFLPVTEDMSKYTQVWKNAMARAVDKKMPWLIISNGKDIYEGPWPESVDKTMELLRRYGGN